MNVENKKGNLDVSIEFLGATSGIVTGSCNLVKITRFDQVRTILVDYGSFQGEFEKMDEDRVILGEDIDCVLLTHAHLDHCGGIPKLFKTNDDNKVSFSGKIYGSRETLAQAVHILKDSAKVNEQIIKGLRSTMDKEKQSLYKSKEKLEREYANHHEIANIDSAVSSINEQEEVPYGLFEVEETIKHFAPIELSEDVPMVTIPLFDGIEATFIPTSHINGSTMIELRCFTEDESYTMVFTGDIGSDNTILYKPMHFVPNYDVDCVVMESLHGVQKPIETLEDSKNKLKNILKHARKKNKAVIIPTFSLDRSAGIITILNEFMSEGMRLNCYVDSPLIIKELLEYVESYVGYNSAWFKFFMEIPFDLSRFNVAEKYQDHICISKYNGFNVFVTSSCMGFGGRVIDYFEHHIQEKDSIFVFPGYLTTDSPSRALLDAPMGSMVELNGRRYIKHCETYQLHGFSSHGYLPDKIKILEAYPSASTIFLNHGDSPAIYELLRRLEWETKANIVIPEYEESFKLY